MSLTRVHNLSISLDGFATGEPQSADAPFGHAGERLHEWMFRTRFWDADGTGLTFMRGPGASQGLWHVTVDGRIEQRLGTVSVSEFAK